MHQSPHRRRERHPHLALALRWQRGAAGAARPREAAAGRPARRETSIEETLLAYCLVSEREAGYLVNHVELSQLQEGFYRDWIMEIFRKMETEGWEAATRILPNDPQAEQKEKTRAKLLTVTRVYGKAALAFIDECIIRLKNRYLGQKISEKRQEYTLLGNLTEKERIQKELHDLTKRRSASGKV